LRNTWKALKMSTKRTSLKRKGSSEGNMAGPAKQRSGAAGGAVARPGPWSLGLKQSMSDPQLVVDDDDRVVVIKDKYPKARFHFLVLPKDNIPNLKSLTKDHLPLLRYMSEKGKEVASKASTSATFRLGYHAVPSMSGLHLHVISDDFNSTCLKTKKHWNSFTTSYFVPSSEVISLLQEKGEVNYNRETYMKLLDSPLRCHVCKNEMATMPALKEHIKSHIKL